MKDLHFKITVLSALAILSVFGLKASFGVAESAEDLADVCLPEKIEQSCQSITPADCRVILEKCESYYSAESARIESDLTKTSAQKKTLQNTVNSLNSKIKNISYQINQNNLVIKDLSLQIEDTSSSIDKTSLKIEDSKQMLTGIMRTIYEEDQRSIAEIFLAEGVSDFFDNLVSLEALNEKNKELLDQIKSLKVYLEDQKQSLDAEKGDMEKAVALQTLAKQESEGIKKQQENLLAVTKGKEDEYQKLLAATKKRAQEINSRLFELIGVPAAPTFGEAYQIAKFVSSQTGIRPALLLAVLTQESNVGRNVGQCFLKNLQTGEGVRAKTGQVEIQTMSPKRDVPSFSTVTSALNRDIFNTPVSCPMKDSLGRPVGWGGAMGPSQFIPSTWVLYDDKISAITGVSADPWNIKDAFLATGIYLKDLGAGQSEFNAVMRYFSGNTWSKWEEFYGRSVMSIASQYESDIKDLESNLN